jgi:hypothetical protein
MTDPERDTTDTPPIDESTYAGSSSETGGNYTRDGATSANTDGDSMAVLEDEEGEDTPGSDDVEGSSP